MKNRVSLILIIILICIGSFLHAESVGKGGKTLAGIINVEPGARANGMGCAFGAVADRSIGLYYNPAAIGIVPFKEITVDYTKFVEDINYFNVTYLQPLKILNFAVSVGYLSLGKFQEIADYSPIGTSIHSGDMLAVIGLGKKIKKISIGGNIKYLYQSIFSEKRHGFFFDAGIIYSFRFLDASRYQKSNTSIGLSVINVGFNTKLNNLNSKMPAKVKTSLAYKPHSSIMIAMDLNVYFTGIVAFDLGIEGLPDWYFSPRAGYRVGLSGKRGFVFGLGSKLRKDPFSGSIDYAFLMNEILGFKHNVTLTINFGTFKTEFEKEFENSKNAHLNNKKIFNESMESGRKHLYDGLFSESIKEFEKALKIDPENEELNELYSIALERKKEQENEFQYNTYINEGNMLISENSYSNALIQFQKALKIKPNGKIAKDKIALINDKFEAIDLYNEGLKAFNNKEYGEAITRFLTALEKDSENEVIQSKLDAAKKKMEIENIFEQVKFYIETGENELAIIELNNILKIDPKNKKAMNMKKKLYKK